MRLSFGAVVLLAACAIVQPSYAADPQSYTVDMASTGDDDLDGTLEATSDLLTLRKSAPVGPFALIGRARGDLERLKTVLESAGYYQSYVAITIDDLPLDDPGLGAELSARGPGSDARVKITFSLGRPYHVGRIDLDGQLPPEFQGALGLKSGDPAVASEVLAAGERLQTALQDRGFAFAAVEPPVAYEDPDRRVLNITFHVVTGPAVQIGNIRIQGLKRMRESFVRRRLLVHTGEPYGATKVEAARKDLLALGVFSSVTVQLGSKPDSTGKVPLTFRVRERPEHAVSISGAYSSDLGGSTGVTWSSRNISGRADQLTLAASVINLGGGSANTGIGYDTSAKYLVPDFKARDQSLLVSVAALKQSLQAYDQIAGTVGLTLSRKLSNIWTISAGFSIEQERITQNTAVAAPGGTVCAGPASSTTAAPGCVTTFRYTLLGLPLTALYNTTGLDSPLEDAVHGMRASLNVTPTLSVGHPNTRFVTTQATVATYFDLQNIGLSDQPGRRVLALRALAGVSAGAGEFSLPPDQRFYAGGSGTIRGFRYQSVGPLFANGNPIGGTAINAGTAEFRQRIGRNFGATVFVDAGQVSATVNAWSGALRFGAGAGVRYYTPIGPIRLDIAAPLDRRPGDDAFEVYIGLGQAF